MRAEVVALKGCGHLLSSELSVHQLEHWQKLFEDILPPISPEEAASLATLFPSTDDDCFGLAWSLLHLIESCPEWPIQEVLENGSGPWIDRLRRRLR